jgi:acetyltransferase-like isoleucine patch superfamily enzyme
LKKIIRNFLNQDRKLPAVDPYPNVKIGKGCYIHNCEIGEYTYLSVNVSVMNTKIGRYCSIAQGACISLGMHPSSGFVSTHPSFFSTHQQSAVTFAEKNHFREMGEASIGNDVWIGVNAVIMDDITIGDGAIIGAGAIVTRDVPPYAIVAGNPARLLRYRFDQHEIDFLLEFKWWEKDPEWLRANQLLFRDIKSFIKNFQNP